MPLHPLKKSERTNEPITIDQKNSKPRRLLIENSYPLVTSKLCNTKQLATTYKRSNDRDLQGALNKAVKASKFSVRYELLETGNLILNSFIPLFRRLSRKTVSITRRILILLFPSINYYAPSKKKTTPLPRNNCWEKWVVKEIKEENTKI